MKCPKIITFLACLLLFSCKQAAQHSHTPSTSDSTKKHTTAVTHSSGKPDKAGLVHNIRTYVDSIQNILPGMSPRQADMLYKAARHFISDQITLATGEEHFIEWYCDLSDPAAQPDSVRHELKLYESAGLEAWDIGEGYLELRTRPDFYVRIFGTHVSGDYASFIKLTCSEDSVLYQADAGLILSFPEIAQRLLNWEQFLKDFPGSDLRSEAKEKYIAYLYGYLLGEDNTPTFEDNVLQEGPIAAYKAMAAKHPDTFTGMLSAQFLERFSNRNTTSEERQAFLDEAATDFKAKQGS